VRHIYVSVAKSSVHAPNTPNLVPMSALNKMMGYLGLVDTDEEAVRESTPVRVAERPAREIARPIRDRAGVTVVGTNPSVAESHQQEANYHIITLQPRSYSEARKMGEHYREGNPVIINLDDMEEGERKRLVDFASGLVFGLHGRIERVSHKVFLLSPANVNVSSEDKTAAAQASFFNQS
jgi:cell division inhibitor SepF